MSRLRKSIKNARITLAFYALTIVVAFFSRKIFLDYLGDDFVGLISLIQQILGFLNLAELGISTAIGYSLYKPIYNNDKEEINDIIWFLGSLYRKIGLIVLLLGLLVSAFFPYIFSDTPFTFPIIYYAFFVFLFSAISNYFFNYHITLLEADQKQYVITKFYQGSGILKSLVQILLIYLYRDFVLWITIELIFSGLLIFVLRQQIKKEYNWLKISLPRNKELVKDFPEILKKVKQIVVHKFSFFVLTGTDQILIYSFVNLQSVAFYGNYLLIFGYLGTFVNNAFSGIQAGIGNLVAENDQSNIKKVFWEFMAARHFIGGFLFISLYYLTDPFIEIWLGEKYLLGNSIVYFMIVNIYIGQIRKPLDTFINAFGQFQDVWAPATQAALNLGISLVLGHYYGILGIVLGSTVSLIMIVLIWKPYFLYSKGFRIPVYRYWLGFLKMFLPMIITFYLVSELRVVLFAEEISEYYQWIWRSVKICLTVTLIYGTSLFMLNKGFRDLLNRFKFSILRYFQNER